MARNRRSPLNTLKSRSPFPPDIDRTPGQLSVVTVEPSTARKYTNITAKLIDHGYYLDWADEYCAVFIRGNKQVTVLVPPEH